MKKRGYYDLLLATDEEIKTSYTTKLINEESSFINNLDSFLLDQLQNLLAKHLFLIDNTDDKITLINKILKQFSDKKFSNNILLHVNGQENVPSLAYQQQNFRLSGNHFFSNDQEQKLIDYLNTEMQSCEKIILIYPFIAKSLLNKLQISLQFCCKNNIPIEIITTTFDQTSAFNNLYELEQLITRFNNINIKIEDNTEQRSDRIHIKAAIFIRDSGFSTALIGSSNLTSTGMQWGREWNLKISKFSEEQLFAKIYQAYQQLIHDNLLDFNNVKLRQQLMLKVSNANTDGCQNKLGLYYLYDFQQIICQKLQYRRKLNKNKHLVIMATGTGKTIVSAFDYLQQIKNKKQTPKLLFLAHQKEIIEQAHRTFQAVLQDNAFGTVLSTNKQQFTEQFLFATVQTVSRHLQCFKKNQFDLIIFDEAHHIAAKSFTAIFNYFTPKEVIGLTATPEREDNQSILPFFEHEYAHELRLWEAIDQRLLAKFDYYCIDDSNSNLAAVDLNDEQQVFKVLNNESRNQLLLQVIKNYIGYYSQPLTLIFCINTEHAAIVAAFLLKQGLKAAFLTSKNLILRSKILHEFKTRKINYLCVVNIFNEGVDVPEIDTLILLRPTTSKTVYLQQLGRGLRKTKTKNKVAIYDLIANINVKYDITVGIKNLYQKKKTSNKQTDFFTGYDLPKGCTITLENKSREIILNNLQNWYQVTNRLKAVVENYYALYQAKGLAKLLEDYDLSIYQFYQSLDNFYLKIGAKIKTFDVGENDMQRNKNVLKQFLFLNHYHIINYFYHRLKKSPDLTVNYQYDNLLVASLFYEVTSFKVFNQYFNNDERDIISKFLSHNKLIVKELLLILKYKLDHEILLTNKPKNKNYLLLVSKATFTVRQALCAIGRVNFIIEQGPLKIIAFQAGYLTFEQKHTVVFADLNANNYGKKTSYQADLGCFAWSIPESKSVTSKLVTDLQDHNLTKFLFLHNTFNLQYTNLWIKLYDFVGFGQYQTTLNEKFVTIIFKIK